MRNSVGGGTPILLFYQLGKFCQKPGIMFAQNCPSWVILARSIILVQQEASVNHRVSKGL